MPVVGIPVDLLQHVLGRDLGAHELERTLGLMGCDVEGVQSVGRAQCRRCGFIVELGEQEEIPPECGQCATDLRADGATSALPDLEVVKMDLLAVRPDLFDPGGLGRALRGYLGLETGLPELTVEDAAFEVHVEKIVTKRSSYRPYIVCAVLDPVRLDGDRIKVLMKLQENLHWALGRNRKQASIGVYDLDAIEGPVTYTAKEPSFAFLPLGADPKENPWPLQRILEEHPKGRAYKDLLEGYTHYPILVDAKGQVLSMPPVINSEQTRVTEGSKRLFVDVTGLSLRAITSAINILATSLQVLMPEMKIRGVRVHGPGGKDRTTPDLAPTRHKVRLSEARRILGLSLERDDAAALLGRMRHGVAPGDGDGIELDVAPYRNDILHEVDLIEDLAIAYGYDRVPQILLPATTIPRERPVETLTARAREVLAGLGLVEVMTLVLSSPEVNDLVLGREPSPEAVLIANPISKEQSQVRTHLVAGLLQALAQNRHRALPQKIFEIGDVSLLDGASETLAREERRLALAVVHPKAGFAEVKAMAEAVAREFECSVRLEACDEPPFLPGRGAAAFRTDGRSGDAAVFTFGEVHPEVLERLGLANPVVVLEGSLLTLAGREPAAQDEWRRER